MSDTDEKFESWKEQGKYLAGCEVVDNALPPNNCYQIKKLKEVL